MTKTIPKFGRKVMRDPNLEKQKLRHWHWHCPRNCLSAKSTHSKTPSHYPY